MRKNAKNAKRMRNAEFDRDIIDKCGMHNAGLHIDKCGIRNAEICGKWKKNAEYGIP